MTDRQLLEQFLRRDDPAAAEAAFTALVERHGPMVLSVCRRELGNPHDAYDAFQATFLVLVSKAGSIRHRETVGGWLFGIARRVAARARVEGARRRRHLERFGTQFGVGESSESPRPDADFTPLIAEVAQLPERFRDAVVLHYFEGLSTEATAQRLGCARGTVLSRLARARDRLRRRLEARGAAPSILIPAAETARRWLPPQPVPAALAQSTTKAASSLALAGTAIESVVPAAVVRLSRGVARTMALSRAGIAAGLCVLAGTGVSIGLAATLSPRQILQSDAAMRKPQVPAANRPVSASDREQKSEPVVVRGRVVDPGGKPVAGAEILLSVAKPGLGGEPRHLGDSGPGGRFEVSVPRDAVESPPGIPETPFGAALAAMSPGFGPDWAPITPKNADQPIDLKLRRDDVSIEGRVISLEGRPIPGLSVRAAYIAEFPPALMSKLRENAGKMNPELWGEMRNVIVPGQKGPLRPVRTGTDGRFQITGIGRDRVALLMIEGAAIEQSFAMVSTTSDRDYKPVLLPADGSGERKIEAPRFELAAAPGRAIEGTIRDRDTGRPVAGAEVMDWVGLIHKTDAQGRYRLVGQPGAAGNVPNFLYVSVDGQPYIKFGQALEQPRGLGPMRVDVALKRGVWAQGKVTNRATGKPVRAVVIYYPFRDNPNVKDCPGATFLNNHVGDEPEFPTDADGRFRTPVLPGRGLLAVRAGEPGYLNARPLDDKTAGSVLRIGDFRIHSPGYHAFVPIDAPAGKTLVIPEISLGVGRPQHIRIVDPDGKPVTETRLLCPQSGSLAGEAVAGYEKTFIHANPGKAESLIVWQAERSLGATIDLKGDEPDPVRLVLRPTGTVIGRLVDEDGKPRPGVHLAINQRYMSRGEETGSERFGPLTTGPDGRFRIKDLVPGLTYYVEAIKRGERNFSLRAEGYLHQNRWTIKPGESVDWGEVRVKPYPR